MSHSNELAIELVEALKAELKSQGWTYARLAGQLNLSESSVKRLFASGNLSLHRLAEICDVLGLEIADLADLTAARRRHIDQLSEEQEQALVSDPKLFLVAFLLFNHWSFARIITEYQIDQLEGIQLLARLDRMGIIDLLPGNRVRMRLSRRFAWRPHGPIQAFFEHQVQTEFFSSRFDGPLEQRIALHGMLSERSVQIMQRRMQRLQTEFEALVKEDRHLGLEHCQGMSTILAIRPWSLALFDQFLREPPTED